MKKQAFLLYCEAQSQAPAPIIGLLPGLRIVASLEELHNALSLEHPLTFVQAKGKMRQDAVRLLCRQKQDFALLGLEKDDLDNATRLAQLARKKKLRLCWLGSLRFCQGAARVKELLQSGCCGTLLTCECKIDNTTIWQQYQIDDLVNWLLQEEQSTCKTKYTENTEPKLNITLRCSMAQLELTLLNQQESKLKLKFEGQKERSMSFKNSPILTELGLLLKVRQEEKDWPLLAKPWEAIRKMP
ncbi:MAG: hypothetical protein GX946_01390 [Oligosphaeraceae bacterium]|nr:hypothetical protein [Oligosphaeraceae bacterium]